VLFTSAQIGKTVLLKRTVSVFFYLPQGCEEDKVLGKCCQQDRLVTTSHEKGGIMFGAFVHTTKNTELIEFAGD